MATDGQHEAAGGPQPAGPGEVTARRGAPEVSWDDVDLIVDAAQHAARALVELDPHRSSSLRELREAYDQVHECLNVLAGITLHHQQSALSHGRTTAREPDLRVDREERRRALRLRAEAASPRQARRGTGLGPAGPDRV